MNPFDMIKTLIVEDSDQTFSWKGNWKFDFVLEGDTLKILCRTKKKKGRN